MSDTLALSMTEEEARALDSADALSTSRTRFAIPPADGGDYAESAYLAGNSLGLLSDDIRAILTEELDSWARWGVERTQVLTRDGARLRRRHACIRRAAKMTDCAAHPVAVGRHRDGAVGLHCHAERSFKCEEKQMFVAALADAFVDTGGEEIEAGVIGETEC